MFTCFYAGIILSEINVSTGKFETNADLRKVAQKNGNNFDKNVDIF